MIVTFTDQIRWKLITATMRQDGIDQAVYGLITDLERTGFLRPVFR